MSAGWRGTHSKYRARIMIRTRGELTPSAVQLSSSSELLMEVQLAHGPADRTMGGQFRRCADARPLFRYCTGRNIIPVVATPKQPNVVLRSTPSVSCAAIRTSNFRNFATSNHSCSQTVRQSDSLQNTGQNRRRTMFVIVGMGGDAGLVIYHCCLRKFSPRCTCSTRPHQISCLMLLR